MIEAAASGAESQVNAVFAIQGIKQVLNGRMDRPETLGAWRIVEARQLSRTILSLLPEVEDEDTAMEKETPEEEEHDEDEDENAIQITVTVIDFLLYLGREGSQTKEKLFNFEQFFSFDEASIKLLCRRFDEDIGEKR